MPSRSAGPWPVDGQHQGDEQRAEIVRGRVLAARERGLVDDRRRRQRQAPHALGRVRALAGLEQVAAARERGGRAERARPACRPRPRRPRAAAARWRRRLDELSTSARSSDQADERSGSASSRASTPSRIPSLTVLAAGKCAPGVVGRGAAGREVAHPGGRGHARARRQRPRRACCTAPSIERGGATVAAAAGRPKTCSTVAEASTRRAASASTVSVRSRGGSPIGPIRKARRPLVRRSTRTERPSASTRSRVVPGGATPWTIPGLAS